jgi:ribulose-phosphate 3-epimerase
MIQIVPAILDKTPEDFEKHITQLKNSLGFQEGWVHIDFADNKFVPNETIEPSVVSEYPTDLKKEAHLMVSRPLGWIKELKEAGFDRVIFHFEADDNIDEVIEAIKNAGMEVGVAINPETQIEWLEPYKDSLDQVLIMGIVPGFQGQPFIPATIDKIKNLKSKDWPVKISVDGAIRDTNARELMEAGADQLVSGSFLLSGDIDENVEKIWEAIHG